jgi:hypothetical protein
MRWATSEWKLEAEIIIPGLATGMLSQSDLTTLLVPGAEQIDESSLTGWASSLRNRLSASQNFTDRIKNLTSPKLVYRVTTKTLLDFK